MGAPMRRLARVAGLGLLLGLAGLLSSCGSSTPMTDKEAVTSAWTTFFDGTTSVAHRAAVLQHGAGATTDIRLFFSLFPADLTTKVDAVRVNGHSAKVIYEFFAGTARLSRKPMTGTAVLVHGEWLVSWPTWSAWVRKSDIHGSG